MHSPSFYIRGSDKEGDYVHPPYYIGWRLLEWDQEIKPDDVYVTPYKDHHSHPSVGLRDHGFAGSTTSRLTRVTSPNHNIDHYCFYRLAWIQLDGLGDEPVIHDDLCLASPEIDPAKFTGNGSIPSGLSFTLCIPTPPPGSSPVISTWTVNSLREYLKSLRATVEYTFWRKVKDGDHVMPDLAIHTLNGNPRCRGSKVFASPLPLP